ncbi:hypothetical protein MRX96_013097 [Rhipicephalus microplus]
MIWAVSLLPARCAVVKALARALAKSPSKRRVDGVSLRQTQYEQSRASEIVRNENGKERTHGPANQYHEERKKRKKKNSSTAWK